MKYTLFRIFHTIDAEPQPLGATGAYSDYVACYADDVNLGKASYASALVSMERCLMGPSCWFPLVLWFDVSIDRGIDKFTETGFCVAHIRVTQGGVTGPEGWNQYAGVQPFEALRIKRNRASGRAAVRRFYNTSEAASGAYMTVHGQRRHARLYRETKAFHNVWFPTYQAIADVIPFLTDEADLQRDGKVLPLAASEPPSIPAGTTHNVNFERAANDETDTTWRACSDLFGHWLYHIAAMLKTHGAAFLAADYQWHERSQSDHAPLFDLAQSLAAQWRLLGAALGIPAAEGKLPELAALTKYPLQNWVGFAENVTLAANDAAIRELVLHLKSLDESLQAKRIEYQRPIGFTLVNNPNLYQQELAMFYAFTQLVPMMFSVFNTIAQLHFLWVVKKPAQKRESAPEVE